MLPRWNIWIRNEAQTFDININYLQDNDTSVQSEAGHHIFSITFTSLSGNKCWNCTSFSLQDVSWLQHGGRDACCSDNVSHYCLHSIFFSLTSLDHHYKLKQNNTIDWSLTLQRRYKLELDLILSQSSIGCLRKVLWWVAQQIRVTLSPSPLEFRLWTLKPCIVTINGFLLIYLTQ